MISKTSKKASGAVKNKRLASKVKPPALRRVQTLEAQMLAHQKEFGNKQTRDSFVKFMSKTKSSSESSMTESEKKGLVERAKAALTTAPLENIDGSLLADPLLLAREKKNKVSGATWVEPLGPDHVDTFYDADSKQYRQSEGEDTGYWAIAIRPGSYDVNLNGHQVTTEGLKWTSYKVSKKESLNGFYTVKNVSHPNVYAEGGRAVYGQVERLYLHKDGSVMVDLTFKKFKVYSGTHASLYQAINNLGI